jgi:transcriptional regulator with XRE-family HTH domain
MKALRSLRTSKGISMKALGQEIGVSESTISLYETGKRSPDIATMILLADYFDVTVDHLIGHENKPGAEISGGLSEGDTSILRAYHSASEEDRQIIDNIVLRYTPSKIMQTG